jgi:hypothetical protein
MRASSMIRERPLTVERKPQRGVSRYAVPAERAAEQRVLSLQRQVGNRAVVELHLVTPN